MTPQTLKEILDQHQVWLSSENEQGKRADLSRADLSCVDLSGMDLSGASLSGANLSHANLSRTTLSRADMSGANLSHANLSSANLSRANLSRADLFGAILPYTIYQFFAGKFNAVATQTELRIGCEAHPWDVWLDEKKRQEIADSAQFTDEEYDIHSALIKTFHELLQLKEKATP